MDKGLKEFILQWVERHADNVDIWIKQEGGKVTGIDLSLNDTPQEPPETPHLMDLLKPGSKVPFIVNNAMEQAKSEFYAAMTGKPFATEHEGAPLQSDDEPQERFFTKIIELDGPPILPDPNTIWADTRKKNKSNMFHAFGKLPGKAPAWSRIEPKREQCSAEVWQHIEDLLTAPAPYYQYTSVLVYDAEPADGDERTLWKDISENGPRLLEWAKWSGWCDLEEIDVNEVEPEAWEKIISYPCPHVNAGPERAAGDTCPDCKEIIE